MRKFLVERELPGAANLSAAELKDLSRAYCEVVRQMKSGIQWVESYLTPEGMICVFLAESEYLVREHAMRGEFPVTRITRVLEQIDPLTASSEVNESTRTTRSSLKVPIQVLQPTVWRMGSAVHTTLT